MEEYITVFTDMYGISENDKEKAERCIESTIEYIKNYCHIDSIPAMMCRHHLDSTTMSRQSKRAMLPYRTAVIQAVCRACLKTTKQGLHVSESWCGNEYCKTGY